jgi:hypothetical protein
MENEIKIANTNVVINDDHVLVDMKDGTKLVVPNTMLNEKFLSLETLTVVPHLFTASNDFILDEINNDPKAVIFACRDFMLDDLMESGTLPTIIEVKEDDAIVEAFNGVLNQTLPDWWKSDHDDHGQYLSDTDEVKDSLTEYNGTGFGLYVTSYIDGCWRFRLKQNHIEKDISIAPDIEELRTLVISVAKLFDIELGNVFSCDDPNLVAYATAYLKSYIPMVYKDKNVFGGVMWALLNLDAYEVQTAYQHIECDGGMPFNVLAFDTDY